MNNQKLDYKKLSVDILFDIVSGIIFAVGLNSFSAPNEIAPGGFSGIAVLTQHLFGIPMGAMMMAANIPLLLLAWRFLGREFTLNTFKTVVIHTFILDFAASLLPDYTGEPILAGLFGGILIGVSLALVFMRNSTTGGGDVVSRLIQLKFRHLPIGKTMFMFDTLVLVASALVFRNIESALYGTISIFATAKVIDAMLYGLYTGKVLLVVSGKQQDIANEIMEKLDRGVTLLKGVGAYSGSEKQVLMCAVRAPEYHNVEEIIKRNDPDAFVVTLEANEIRGEGFYSITQDKLT